MATETALQSRVKECGLHQCSPTCTSCASDHTQEADDRLCVPEPTETLPRTYKVMQCRRRTAWQGVYPILPSHLWAWVYV